MAPSPIVVIADDLTGAAEIAAIGHRHGMSASVVTNASGLASTAELLVFDTDSRLDDAKTAAEKISALGKKISGDPPALLYKKTDSVLRGPVRAELEALARSLNAQRILLVPANPALGRTIRSGAYAIQGVPLHETAFARDPHHPAKTSEACQLLGVTGALPVNACRIDTPLPLSGIIIGDAFSNTDLVAWARRAPPDAVLAGAAEFFSALLDERGFSPRSVVTEPALPDGAVLAISGTTHSAGATLRANAARADIPILAMPPELSRADVGGVATNALQRWTENMRAQLADRGRALAVFDGPVSSDPPIAAAIRRAFGELARELLARHAVQHVIIEGGATAAAITRALGWHELHLMHAWAPGVASLRPDGEPKFTLTLKPGSYAWPSALWQNFAGSNTKSFHA
jgi:uncharacterized protein YgbK (DUF1537 family)